MTFVRTNKFVLLGEAILIVFVLNSSSFLSTTTYERSIDIVGILLTLGLIVWITLSAWHWSGRAKQELALQSKGISRRQWRILVTVVLSLFLVAFVSEWLSPTQFVGPITPSRVVMVAAFTLTFGPLFEEFVFRGYLFARIQDVARGRTLDLRRFDLSFASIFSGLLFGLWHLPSPILVQYFHDPLMQIYAELAPFIVGASFAGIILGEIRRRTGSLLPGIILHLSANSIYVIAMAGRLF